MIFNCLQTKAAVKGLFKPTVWNAWMPVHICVWTSERGIFYLKTKYNIKMM